MLTNLMERPNVSNFSWNYTIFRQISESKYKDWFLGWGDSCCREPLEGEEVRGNQIQIQCSGAKNMLPLFIKPNIQNEESKVWKAQKIEFNFLV